MVTAVLPTPPVPRTVILYRDMPPSSFSAVSSPSALCFVGVLVCGDPSLRIGANSTKERYIPIILLLWVFIIFADLDAKYRWLRCLTNLSRVCSADMLPNSTILLFSGCPFTYPAPARNPSGPALGVPRARTVLSSFFLARHQPNARDTESERDGSRAAAVRHAALPTGPTRHLPLPSRPRTRRPRRVPPLGPGLFFAQDLPAQAPERCPTGPPPPSSPPPRPTPCKSEEGKRTRGHHHLQRQ